MHDKPVTDAELLATIRGIVADRDVVTLSGHLFDRVPCSRRKVYALCRKHAGGWGYDYKGAEYHASGNRAFQRNHKRGYRSGPSLFKRKGPL